MPEQPPTEKVKGHSRARGNKRVVDKLRLFNFKSPSSLECYLLTPISNYVSAQSESQLLPQTSSALSTDQHLPAVNMKTSYLLPTMALAMGSSAHMSMIYPAALKSKNNPHAGYDIDYSITSPLSADGSNFPCKGYLSLLGTPQGKSVATWNAGGSYNFTIAGGANHNGGSCQASLSLDGGKTFRVLHSYEGGCPASGTSSYNFRVPADVPPTEGAIFAWSWFNNLGNREMYMNCAVVDIVGGGGSAEKVSFASRPTLFKANVGNGCTTVESVNVKFPQPGPDLDSNGASAPPVGNCGGAADPGTGSGAGSGAVSGSGASPGGGSSGEQAAPTSVPSRSRDCQTNPRPTAAPSSDKSGGGPRLWTPGNDWPDWFQSAATRGPAPGHLVLSVFAVMTWAYCVLV